MQIGFVFTNYNNTAYTREAVRSLAASAHRDHFAIVVVDNASRPDEVAALVEVGREFPAVQLILHQENVGYFPGLNLGIRHLRGRRPELDCVVVGNNDLVFPPDFHDRVEASRGLLARYAVVAPDLVTLDGVHQNPHVISGISPVRELVWDVYYSHHRVASIIGYLARLTRRFTARRDMGEHRVARPIWQPYGACFILTPVFFAHFDELWAPTFLMGEEYFLSHQVEARALELYYDPGIVVVHHEHATVSTLPSRRFWEMSRDAHRVYRRHVSPFRSRSRNPNVIGATPGARSRP